ncbi:hypothetical protein [Roseimarinus sediminis]|uniref:hypothetical protein n=1 Tax=Roseimarinus sediminis TaxID=1610899 RepID=UPI003D2601EA
MKKITRWVAILLIITGALAFFKPSESDFEAWVNARSAKKRTNAKGDNMVERLADKAVTSAEQVQLLSTYRYSNHHVIAIVEAGANGEKKKFLGIAGTWIPLP